MVLSLSEYAINTDSNSETQVSPFRSTFGTLAEIYAEIPRNGSVAATCSAFIKNLDTDLSKTLVILAATKVKNSAERTRNDPLAQNILQPGDLILVWLETRPHKLLHKWAGPYRTIEQIGNDVTMLDLVTGETIKEHCGKIKRFYGSEELALAAARLDNDQILIDKFISYKGDPNERTTMQFLVRFVDGGEVSRTYDKDISDTIQFAQFCKTRLELQFLVILAKDAKVRTAAIKRAPIDKVKTGDVRFADLRSWGYGWFDSLLLPHSHSKTYVVRCEYGALGGTPRSPSINAFCPIFNETWPVDNIFISFYGHQHSVLTEDLILIDEDLLLQFPRIKP